MLDLLTSSRTFCALVLVCSHAWRACVLTYLACSRACVLTPFFSIRVFFHGHWWLTGQQVKGGDHLFFNCTTFTHSWTFRDLFATLHVIWLSQTFNRTACIYETATRLDSSPYRVTILVFGCLRDDLILAFLIQQFKTGNGWIRTGIDYNLCITSETTNQVC